MMENLFSSIGPALAEIAKNTPAQQCGKVVAYLAFGGLMTFGLVKTIDALNQPSKA